MKKYISRQFATTLATATAVSAAMVVGHSAPVVAQGFDLQQFNPMPDLRQNFLGTSSADVAHHMNWSAFALFNYADDPLVLNDVNGDRVDALVSSQGTMHLMGSIALFNLLEVGIDLPLIMFQGAGDVALSSVNAQDASFAVTDIRLVPKVQLINTRKHYTMPGFALAALVDLHIPTGSSETLQGGDFRIGPRVAADMVLGNGLRFGANLGYQYRSAVELENLSINDTFGWALAAELPVGDVYAVTGEVFGRLTPAGGVEREDSPTEFLVGGKGQFGPAFVMAGAGMGLVNGYGTPDWRGFLGVGFATPRPGYVEPATPECYAATVVQDCPEVLPSTCEDGVITSYGAACVDGACEYTSTQVSCDEGMMCGDADGEPVCVEIPECAADTVSDDCTAIPATTCEGSTLTTYGAACEDGNCIYVASATDCGEGMTCGEVDGAPACVKALIIVDDASIDLSETVLFATGEATIEAVSLPMLDQVAQVMIANPQILKVRVEGHTDNRGNRATNLDLSKRRAAAVVTYLVEQGVPAERLSSEGYGQTKPIATNETDEGRAKNRRVVMTILEMAPKGE